ncbi:hypothetical protein EMIT040CA3_50127 [Bacillus pseudomycoides]
MRETATPILPQKAEKNSPTLAVDLLFSYKGSPYMPINLRTETK